jgi:branched-chain amino acid aminotransferase
MSAKFSLTRTANPVPAEEREAILAAPGLGRYFTDHMTTARWTAEDGWHDRKVGPLVPFSLHPSAAVFHYAQEVFEGLKAYRHADGSVQLFRPEQNARRLATSARRMGLPVLPEDDFLTGIAALVRADEQWIPTDVAEGCLYIRPFMFADEPFLGVRPARRVLYSVIASPAQPYFSSANGGVTLWVTTSYTRAGKGGTGAVKCGGNYGASLAAQVEAQQQGCEQVLFLDSAGEDGCVEESGAMNVFLVTSDGELVTPALGLILEGITRGAVLTLAAEFGLRPVERPVTFKELRAGLDDGAITEVFASGTAAAVTPVIGIRGDGYSYTVGDGRPGKHTAALRDRLIGIQYGHSEDTYDWMRPVA